MRQRTLLASALSCFVLVGMVNAAPLVAQDYDYNGGYSGGGGTSHAASVNFETRLSAVEDQLRTLTGKLEQIEFAVRRMDQAQGRAGSDNDMRLQKLEQQMQNVTAQIAAPNFQAGGRGAAASDVPNAGGSSDDEDVTGTLGALKMRGGSVTGGVNKQKTPALPATSSDYGLSSQEQYDKAFGYLRAASYDDAEKAFKAFIDKNPKDKLIDNAKYWYAETFYVRGKFGDSAVSFAEAYEANPKGAKAPDALLKLAMSLGSLNKTDDACATLVALKTKFPNAPKTISARAEQEKARLKCGN